MSSSALRGGHCVSKEQLQATARVVGVSCRTQLIAFRRAPVTTLLTVLLPVNLLFLLSLFALTGYAAPTALVYQEDTPTPRQFVAALEAAHHSFDLRPMSAAKANSLLSR